MDTPRLDTATAAGEIFTATGDGAATASGWSEKKLARFYWKKNPPRDLGFSFRRKGVLAHVQKKRFFRSAGNYFGGNKPVWLIFRKDNYFYVLGKKPRDLGFLFSGEKSWFFVLAHFQKKFGFYLPGNRRQNLCVFFPRPPRSRYKARCNHIRDLLRDETFFAVDAVCYGSACYFSVFSWSPLFTFFRLVCDLRPTVHTVVFLAATYRSRCF